MTNTYSLAHVLSTIHGDNLRFLWICLGCAELNFLFETEKRQLLFLLWFVLAYRAKGRGSGSFFIIWFIPTIRTSGTAHFAEMVLLWWEHLQKYVLPFVPQKLAALTVEWLFINTFLSGTHTNLCSVEFPFSSFLVFLYVPLSFSLAKKHKYMSTLLKPNTNRVPTAFFFFFYGIIMATRGLKLD